MNNDPYSDEGSDRGDSGSSFYPSAAFGFGSPRRFWGDDSATEDRDAVGAHDLPPDDAYRESGATADGRLDESVIGAVLVAGVVLFLVPEPATSAVGVLLVGVGAMAWLADRYA